MPVIHRQDGFKFFFFSNEGNPREPAHVHVRKAENVAKFWLEPEVALSDPYGMTSSELKKVLIIVIDNREAFIGAWHGFFGK